MDILGGRGSSYEFSMSQTENCDSLVWSSLGFNTLLRSCATNGLRIPLQPLLGYTYEDR